MKIIHVLIGLEMREKMMSDILKTDYSEAFDEKRKHLIEQSYYKYGPARRNFATGNVDAVGCIEKCLEKFKETGNTEYLCDVANYAMFRFMFPQRGEDNKNSKLSKEQVLEIRRIYKKRDRERGGGALARRFGVSDEAIRRCVNGVTWKYT